MGQPTTSVLVTGFNPRLGEENIKAALHVGLTCCGKILDICLTLAADEKQSSGIVQFKNAKAVKAAVRRSGKEIAGGVLSICRHSSLSSSVPGPGTHRPAGHDPVCLGPGMHGTTGHGPAGHDNKGHGLEGHALDVDGLVSQGPRGHRPEGLVQPVGKLQTRAASPSRLSESEWEAATSRESKRQRKQQRQGNVKKKNKKERSRGSGRG